jgi:hypothetical protein
MSIYTIYKATNKVNGKLYIRIRFKLFLTESVNTKTDIKPVKPSSILQYKNMVGITLNGKLSINLKNENYCLCVMEAHYIKEHDTFFHGYNSTLGGEGVIGYKHTTGKKV